MPSRNLPRRIQDILDKNSLLKGNIAEVFKVLQQGIASAEHKDFTTELLGNIKDNDQ